MTEAEVIIPSTAPDRYLSGTAALNIPTSVGTGDWHMIETWFRPRKNLTRLFVAGPGCADDTTSLLGDTGVLECSAVLDRFRIPHPPGPVYAASHARAIADIALVTIREGRSPRFISLDDWMPGDTDKNEVFDLLSLAASKMDADAKERIAVWIAENSNRLRNVNGRESHADLPGYRIHRLR